MSWILFSFFLLNFFFITIQRKIFKRHQFKKNSNNLSKVFSREQVTSFVTNFKSNITYLHILAISVHVRAHKNTHTYAHIDITLSTHREEDVHRNTQRHTNCCAVYCIYCMRFVICFVFSIECCYFHVYCNWEKRSGNSVQGKSRQIHKFLSYFSILNY